MIFTSLRFLVFFVVVFAFYWLPRNNAKVQNIVLLIASYVFYGIAEWRMIPLLLGATVLFYFIGKFIQKVTSEKTSNVLCVAGVIFGIGTLLYFKYFNFFVQSFASMFHSLGLHVNWGTFKILMPLGVSYFTFKLISYVVEVHRGKMEACNDFISFAVYISFFPTILAGPIDRPQKFLNQLSSRRRFTYYQAIDGTQQILWGLFKKIAIADNLGIYVDNVLCNVGDASGSSIVMALIFYTFQMYADFSGYSDMAIGISKLLSVEIAKNFKYPFFATNIAEFWRRWHISLTGWLTDYVFTPLNIKFRDLGKFGIMLAIIINMVLVGIWHGANWTYAVFGLYQGILFIPVILANKMNKKQKLKISNSGLPSFTDLSKMVGIFLLYTIGTILFRASSIAESWEIIQSVSNNLFVVPQFPGKKWLATAIFTILLMLVIEWHQRDKEYGLQFSSEIISKKPLKVLLVDYIFIAIILCLGSFGANQFIYFQF